jgi:predicted metal-dependent phosphoesterase TrpH
MVAAARAGLTVVGLTDHDTAAGWDEAAEAAARCGVALVRGAEISTTSGGISCHMLAYLYDPAEPTLAAELDLTRASRLTRLVRMTDLIGQDYPITWQDVLDQTGDGATVGRPHVADALVAAGVIATRAEAAATILQPGSKYYVPHHSPDTLWAVRAIRAAGGVPVFAHPGAAQRVRVVGEERIEELAAAGLAGLEVDHRGHDDATRRRLRDLAGALGLFVTGSSDYHGAGKPNRLGENTTAPGVLAQIEEQGKLKVLRP